MSLNININGSKRLPTVNTARCLNNYVCTWSSHVTKPMVMICGNVKHGTIAVITIRVVAEVESKNVPALIPNCVQWVVPKQVVDQQPSMIFVKYQKREDSDVPELVDPLNHCHGGAL